MVRPATVPPASMRRRVVAWACLGAVVSVALGLGWVRFHRTGPAATAATERTASELVRQADRLCEKDGGRPFTGWLVERYPDAALKSRSWLSNGVLQGISEGWYTNGTLQVREHYAAGVSKGEVTRWSEDGAKESEGTALDGKLEGVFRRWYPTGRLSDEVRFSAGVPEGLSQAWHPDGSLKAEVRHQNGVIVERRFWRSGEKDGRTLAAQGASAP